jgi:hypothetical protein
MNYDSQINATNPALLVFLVDQSDSMSLSWDDTSLKSRASLTADVLNKILKDLALRCNKGGEIRKRLFFSVIGYGGVPAQAKSALSGNLSEFDTVDVATFSSNPLRIEERVKKESDGVGGFIEVPTKFPIWIDPTSGGGTPMLEAFMEAKEIISNWIIGHPIGFPPIVINITDGEYTTGSPRDVVNSIKGLSTDDGASLVFNIHISKNNDNPLIFPNSLTSMSNDFAKELFEISSELPPQIFAAASELYPGIKQGAKGFAYNAEVTTLANFLNIGTSKTVVRMGDN